MLVFIHLALILWSKKTEEEFASRLGIKYVGCAYNLRKSEKRF